MKLTHRIKNSARTYLLLTGIGVTAVVAAPFAAVFTLLKPDQDLLKKRQKEFFKQVNGSIKNAGTQLKETFKDFDPADLMDPSGSEPWKKQHNKYHDMTDEEWSKRNDV
jgi:hypothetical protein